MRERKLREITAASKHNGGFVVEMMSQTEMENVRIVNSSLCILFVGRLVAHYPVC